MNWRRLLAVVHDVTAAAAAWVLAFWLRFNLDLPPRASGKTAVRRKGAIPFFCKYHPGMKGVIVSR